jgi:hypothetical protein
VDQSLFVIDPELVAIYKKRGEEICEEVLKETAWEKAKKVYIFLLYLNSSLNFTNAHTRL